MIVAFDDHYCWSPTDVSGELAALAEFLVSHPEWSFLRYRDIHWAELAFVVEKADAIPTGYGRSMA